MSRTPERPGADRMHDPVRPAGLAATAKGGEAAARKDAGEPPDGGEGGVLAGIALRFTAWAERWFPDAFIFVAIAVVIVAAGALANGARRGAVTKAFGDGFWSLIPFTMQMAFVTIGGYVVATSPPAQRLIDRFAAGPEDRPWRRRLRRRRRACSPRCSAGASAWSSAACWPARSPRRTELRMDYRAAGAAAYLGLGATWALGLSSSAAQLQANPASLPPALLPITGVIPFTETIFLWQSMRHGRGADRDLDRDRVWSRAVRRQGRDRAGPRTSTSASARTTCRRAQQPGEWLEYSPLLTVLHRRAGARLADPGVRPAERRSSRSPNLNTYNLLFLMLGPAAALAAEALPQRGRQGRCRRPPAC